MPLQVVINGAGQEILVYTPGLENVADVSGVIIDANVSQLAIAAPTAIGPGGGCGPCGGSVRSGWQIQNVGSGTMYVNELGFPASESVVTGPPSSGSVALAPRESIGTLPGCTFQVPLNTKAINIIGVNAGDGYVARSW